jgi:hypothetical protein
MLLEPVDMRVVFFDRSRSAVGVGAAFALCLSLGGCASSNTASPIDARAEAWAPTERGSYPPVGDTPPQREQIAMTADEQAKLRRELTAARDHQVAAVTARDRSGK